MVGLKLVVAFAFSLLFAFSLALAGCLQQDTYSTGVNSGVLNASLSVNASALAGNASGVAKELAGSLAGELANVNASDFQKLIPDSVDVCLHGGTLPEGFFGGVQVLGKPVTLNNRLLAPGAPPEEFSNCGVFVLFSSPEGDFLEYGARVALQKQVARGAGLVVEKTAATRMKADASALGFAPVLEGIVPAAVDAPGNDAALLGEVNFTGELRLSGGRQVKMLLNGVNVTRILPKGQIVAMAVEGTPTGASFPAIVNAVPLSRNVAYYFAYPVRETPAVLNGTVLGMAAAYAGAYSFLRVAG